MSKATRSKLMVALGASAMLLAVPLYAMSGAGGGQQSGDEPQPMDAQAILTSMANVLENAQTLSLEAETATDEVGSDLLKIEHTNLVRAKIERPDKLFAEKSGFENVRLTFDGRTITVMDTLRDKYAQVTGPTDLLELMTLAESKGVDTPLGGLFGADLSQRIAELADVRLVGQVTLDGIETYHIVARQAEVDWQVWVAADSFLPRQIVITSKMISQAPEHRIRIRDIAVDTPIESSAFQFTAPAGAEQVELITLAEIAN
jgi:hypothetical protein